MPNFNEFAKKLIKTKEIAQENVVLAKLKKDQAKENKDKRWRVVEDAVFAARKAYTGGFDGKEDEKTVAFETAVRDLIEVLEKVLTGEVKSRDLSGESQIELPETAGR